VKLKLAVSGKVRKGAVVSQMWPRGEAGRAGDGERGTGGVLGDLLVGRGKSGREKGRSVGGLLRGEWE